MTWNKPTLSSAARGYGAAHRKLRAQWAPLVAAGKVNCWRCGRPIHPWMTWHLGHDDYDRSIYRGPEHKRCNMVGAARHSNMIKVYRSKTVHRW